ncbi:MAG: imidazole glycerol phosphate synthase subunit HisH [Planctomycetes bacterium]|nr:imidazole glycerol phosphate synthase subunit HisH [Planctomycetota bacterium]
MIAVIRYGVGNVKSVLCALRHLGREAILSSDPDEVESASGVILPGVGAFATAMQNLERDGLDSALCRINSADRPILGICLGLQLFFSESEEHGSYRGLGLLSGRVRRFPPGAKAPHMGWNQVRRQKPSALFDGIPDDSFFYFAHSYYAQPDDTESIIGVTDYEGSFASAVARESLFGVQFHPEKSGPWGLRMLANFCHLCE